MTQTQPQQSSSGLLMDIWRSFRALPTWVQMWVMLILAPANMASAVFWNEPLGAWITILTYVAMMLNMPIMVKDRGFSKLMALPHLIPWTILVAIILFVRPEATGAYDTYLWVILVVNTISLLFDYPDAVMWWCGDRDVAGR